MADFTIILPHKRNPGNDAALRICLNCLFANTVNDFHLLMDVATDKPLYERIHKLAVQATTECVIYTCSDTFHAPGWDVPMLAAFQPNRLVFGVVMEPGMIGVHAGNVQGDYGRRPEQYDRAGFESWAARQEPSPAGYGYPAPLMFGRTIYLQYDYPFENADSAEFYPRDDIIIDRMLEANAIERVRVRSYFYHLQRYSADEEKARTERG